MIFGRTEEFETIQRLNKEHRAHFIGVYGRRRVGKTTLIREAFKTSSLYIEVCGIKDGSKAEEKGIFLSSLQSILKQRLYSNTDSSWLSILSEFSEKIRKIRSKNIVIFLDELPWLAGEDTELLSAIDYCWNSNWSKLNNFRIIVCGSASAWMIEKILNNTGGLYNRLTATIPVHPLSLRETELHFNSLKINYPRALIVEAYLALGGIPYYHKLLDPGLSLNQNIQKLFFSAKAPLRDEFLVLLEALYRDSTTHLEILKCLSGSRTGLSRAEIIERTSLSSGGTLERALKELELCDFITQFIPIGKTKKGAYYKITDEYTLFYFYWLASRPKSKQKTDPQFWQKKAQTAHYTSWAGYSFESLCQKHVAGILKDLGLSGILVDVGNWRYLAKNRSESGCQIDLVLDRADKTITLCEIKFNSAPFQFSKQELVKIKNRETIFKAKTKTRKHINSVIITSGGVASFDAISDIFYRQVKLGALFEE